MIFGEKISTGYIIDNESFLNGESYSEEIISRFYTDFSRKMYIEQIVLLVIIGIITVVISFDFALNLKFVLKEYEIQEHNFDKKDINMDLLKFYAKKLKDKAVWHLSSSIMFTYTIFSNLICYTLFGLNSLLFYNTLPVFITSILYLITLVLKTRARAYMIGRLDVSKEVHKLKLEFEKIENWYNVSSKESLIIVSIITLLFLILIGAFSLQILWFIH